MGKSHLKRSACAPDITGNRLRKELSRLWVGPPAFCRPGASPLCTDLFHFEVVIDGPDGSPYAGGTFPVAIDVPRHYPMKPPKITFLTKVYHPNIDEEGQMVLDVFQGRRWSPAYGIHYVFQTIVSVLNDPHLDGAINGDIAAQYKDARDLYEATARDWTRTFSSTPILSRYPDDDSERDWVREHAPTQRDNLIRNQLVEMSVECERLLLLHPGGASAAASPERPPPAFPDSPSALQPLLDPVKPRLTKKFGFARTMWRSAVALLQDFSSWLASSICSVPQLWSGSSTARENQ